MASETPASKIMGGLIEARSVATGEAPAARIHVNGHAYVPATTHQRTLEALREAEKALERIRDLDEADGHNLTWQLAAEAVGIAHHALARIKEATDAQR